MPGDLKEKDEIKSATSAIAREDDWRPRSRTESKESLAMVDVQHPLMDDNDEKRPSLDIEAATGHGKGRTYSPMMTQILDLSCIALNTFSTVGLVFLNKM
jgi:hypothetical protein